MRDSGVAGYPVATQVRSDIAALEGVRFLRVFRAAMKLIATRLHNCVDVQSWRFDLGITCRGDQLKFFQRRKIDITLGAVRTFSRVDAFDQHSGLSSNAVSRERSGWNVAAAQVRSACGRHARCNGHEVLRRAR